MNDTLPPPTPIRPRDTSDDVEYRGFISFEGRDETCPTCEDVEFVRGFEVGLLYARLEAKPPEFRGTYHTENRTVIERVAAAHGYTVEFTPSGGEGWLFATYTRKPSRHLSVVPTSEE